MQALSFKSKTTWHPRSVGGDQREVSVFRFDLLWRSWIAEHLIMPGIVEYPTLIQEAVDQYGDLFA
jgi:hypothetical protein